jgi:hypothetical protein
MGAKRKRIKILLQSESWTAIRHDVFNDVLPKLSPSAQILYLALFDHIWHIPRRRIFACEADMVRWTGLDQRTVSRCLNELLNETEVICCEHLGKKIVELTSLVGRFRSHSLSWMRAIGCQYRAFLFTNICPHIQERSYSSSFYGTSI